MTHVAVAEGLRQLADWIESHPDVEVPYDLRNGLTIFTYSKEDLAKVARSLGKCTKKSDDLSYTVTRNFGPIEVSGYASRGSVCQRVKVGTQKVQKPDPEFTPPMIEVEEDIYEWQCPESLLEVAK